MTGGDAPEAPQQADGELVCERERRDGIVVLRINRPAASNALNAAVMEALGTSVNEAEADPEVRVLIVTGTGDRAFCAGEDLREFGTDAMRNIDPEAMDGFRRLIAGDVRVPVVGAANGAAVGGGFELLLGCDLVVASSTATFGLPEVKRGLLAGGVGVFLSNRVPLAVSLEMGLTGDSIHAVRAADLGLVNQVVAPGEVMDAAMTMARRIAANGPLAVAATKELMRLALVDHDRTSERLHDLLPTIFTSDDAAEGAAAFVDKRPPVWRSR